jgi:ABC-type antimicrobial peptide transport system permease subunit
LFFAGFSFSLHYYAIFIIDTFDSWPRQAAAASWPRQLSPDSWPPSLLMMILMGLTAARLPPGFRHCH